ncbi:MAG: protein kinase domain-containing protein [Endozoicomonas sp.]
MQKLELETAAVSQAGLKEENQDAWGAQVPQSAGTLKHKGAVLAIADGVSACSEARRASHTGITSFTSDYYSTPDSWTVRHSVARVLSALNRWLYQQGHSDAREEGSWCTTFTAFVLKSSSAHIVHTGDSRAWRLRGGQLECLTRDHSASMGGRHYLGRALGMSPNVEVDYKTEILEEGDTLLLTTDGIHDVLSSRQITETLSANTSLNEIAQQLVDKALQQGSTDNLTCVVGRIQSLPAGDQEESLQRLSQLAMPPDLNPGQVLDDYLVLDMIHASKRSQLYLAEDLTAAEGENRQVILKTPSVNFEDDPQYLEGFIREEWIGRRIEHPGVMKVLPPKAGRKYLYHVCEYIKGQTLRDWMQDNPEPSLAQVRDLIRQVISAVRGLHRLQILHQDLKPENLMLEQNGQIRLIDFGSALVAGEAATEPGAGGGMASFPMGTKNYTAPEYFLDGVVDERADQFAIGVIAYELLTGQLPYPEHAGSSIRVRHYQHLQYRSARDRTKAVPEWVDRALAKAVAPDPAKRYPALSEFLQDLRRPNPSFKSRGSQPLMERNPLLVWKVVCLLLLGLNVWQFLN